LKEEFELKESVIQNVRFEWESPSCYTTDEFLVAKHVNVERLFEEENNEHAFSKLDLMSFSYTIHLKDEIASLSLVNYRILIE
jgi:hypothetical protein